MAYNIISCAGFSEAQTGLVASAPCMKSRIGLVILFFIIAIARKWVFEAFELPFNFIIGLIGGIITYLIVVSLFGSFKIALVVGLGAGLALGYFGTLFLGEGG